MSKTEKVPLVRTDYPLRQESGTNRSKILVLGLQRPSILGVSKSEKTPLTMTECP